ncbi:MAG: OadG family protein [Desulfobacteraceae bacterium]|nr:OadG family protein [Desulfobacteraceae bacterium]
MSQPTFIFVAGISGVFCGMALLYISIKIMGAVANILDSDKKEKKNG